MAFKSTADGFDEFRVMLGAIKGDEDQLFTAEVKPEVFINLASFVLVREPGFRVVIRRDRLGKRIQNCQRQKESRDDRFRISLVEPRDHRPATVVGSK